MIPGLVPPLLLQLVEDPLGMMWGSDLGVLLMFGDVPLDARFSVDGS